MKVFGEHINYVAKVLEAKFNSAEAGGEMSLDDKVNLARDFTKIIMTVIVSIFIFGFFGYILVSSETDEATKKLSAGFIGSVIGYWLK